MNSILRRFSPFPGLDDDDSVSEFRHAFGEGDKVRVKSTGHTGEIVHATAGHYTVKLDSTGGHIICRIADGELEPIDFRPAEKRPILPRRESAAESKLAGFLANAGGLMRAMGDGSISDQDRVAVQWHLDNIKAHRDTMEPLGLGEESHDVRMLKVYAEKYAATPGAAPFTKRAGRGDPVGDLIQKAVDGLRVGKNIILPSECRLAFARVPKLQALVASGRISFDYV